MLQNVFGSIFDISSYQRFIGAMPTCVNSENSQIIKQGYLCCPKFDGTRHLWLFQSDMSLLVDRHFYVRDMPLHRNNNQHHRPKNGIYLFDTEIRQSENLAGDKIFNIYVMDLLVANGNSVVDFPFLQRWLTIGVVLEHLSLQFSTMEDHTSLPGDIDGRFKKCIIINSSMFIYHKQQFATKYMVENYDKLISSSGACDGLIFTKVRAPARPFRCRNDEIIKWKPKNKITCDFVVFSAGKKNVFLTNDIYGADGFIFDDGNYVACTCHSSRQSQALLRFTNFYYDQSLEEGTVYEMLFDGSWHVLQQRSDKMNPNNVKTIIQTLNTLKKVVTISDLQDLFS